MNTIRRNHSCVDDKSHLFNVPQVDNNHPLIACKAPQFDSVGVEIKSVAKGSDGVSSTITKDKRYDAFCFGFMDGKQVDFQIVFKTQK